MEWPKLLTSGTRYEIYANYSSLLTFAIGRDRHHSTRGRLNVSSRPVIKVEVFRIQLLAATELGLDLTYCTKNITD